MRTVAERLAPGLTARTPEIGIGLKVVEVGLIAVSFRNPLLNPSLSIRTRKIELQFYLSKQPAIVDPRNLGVVGPPDPGRLGLATLGGRQCGGLPQIPEHGRVITGS